MEIQEWNPAWGPEPVPVRKRPQWRVRNDWHRVWCPRTECANAEGYVIYAPVAKDGREPPEKYVCAICEEMMRLERVGHARGA